MEYYELKQGSKVILYGINPWTKEISEELKNKGIEVFAYFDKRAEELEEIDKIPVYFYDSFPKEISKKNVCVIIMLQNAIQHDEIAMELFKNGFPKIIYVPMWKANNEKAAREFRKIYNLVMLNQFQDIGKIPYFDTIMKNPCEERNTIYEETKDFFTVRVSGDIVYTHSLEILKKRGCKEVEERADMPLAAFKVCINLFEYFEDKDRDAEEYLKYNRTSLRYKNDYTDRDIITKRELLYECWNERFEEGMDFFISSAPLAEWNEKGYFNLLNGQHRTFFLLRKGIKYVPIRISKTDYKRWYKSDIVTEIKKEKMDSCFTLCPIQHPAFQDITFYNKLSIINSMLLIQENLNKKVYKDTRILDISSLNGYYGMHMRRMGAQEITIASPSAPEIVVIRKIAQLYGLSNVKVEEEGKIENIERFSMIIAIGYQEDYKELKYNLITQFYDLEIDSVIFSLSQTERKNMKKEAQKDYYKISNVFLQGERQGIYILQKGEL